ncbi:hypothetical protein [Haloplanus salilacus]
MTDRTRAPTATLFDAGFGADGTAPPPADAARDPPTEQASNHLDTPKR